MKIHCLSHILADPASLSDHPKNRNRHDDAQIERLAELYKYHGIRHPIIVSKQSGFIVAGHGRKLAAIKAGIKEFPVVHQDFDSPEAEYAFIQSDNAIALWAELDLSGINADIGDLGPDFDIDMLGIRNFTIDVADKNEDSDSIPSVPKEAKTKLGDVYQIGNHRLVCGDCTDVNNIQILMDGAKPDLVFTDPPYAMQVEGGSNQPIGKAARKLGEQIKHLCDFDPNAFLNTLATVFPDSKMNAYIFCNKDLVPAYLNWGIDAGYNFNILFWKKPNAIPLGGSHRPDVEYIILFRKSAIWNNGIEGVSYSKCLEYNRDLKEDHPTVKPVDLIINELQISSNRNSPVLDFFGGSGSTMIACEKIARRAYLMELDPKYCDVIISRWLKFTGNSKIIRNGEEIEWFSL